jgi:hypothetical protein
MRVLLRGLTMSYQIEIIDEYSHGEWFSDNLRFVTEAEAVECSQHFGGAGWNGLTGLRVVPSDDPANARWTEKGATDKMVSRFIPHHHRLPRRKYGPKRIDCVPHGKQSSRVWTRLLNADRIRRKVLTVKRSLTVASLLLVLNPFSVCQTPHSGSDCSTLKYLRHKVSRLCGRVDVCSGDICGSPSDYGLDDDITVELRDKAGTTIIDSKKVIVETREEEGTTQIGTKISYKKQSTSFVSTENRTEIMWSPSSFTKTVLPTQRSNFPRTT